MSDFQQDDGTELVLNHFCDSIGSMGFSDEVLQFVCSSYGKEPYSYQFPDGLKSLVFYLERKMDLSLIQNSKMEVDIRVSQMTIEAVFDRLLLYSKFQNYRVLVRGLSNFFKKPKNLLFSSESLYKTLDNIWANLLNDQSTDFNFYSKRFILAAVYIPSFRCFVSDESDRHCITREFIEQKVKQVICIQKIKKKISAFFC